MPEYTEEQLALIRNELDNQDTLNGFVSYEQSERIVTRTSGQLFADFGYFAYELFEKTIDEDECHAEYIPVVIEGKAFGKFPDEGRSGILHLCRISKSKGKAVANPEWFAMYLHCGWIYTSELEMSAAKILENIGNEIDDGATPLTGYHPRG